jgi:hypothetical protein
VAASWHRADQDCSQALERDARNGPEKVSRTSITSAAQRCRSRGAMSGARARQRHRQAARRHPLTGSSRLAGTARLDAVAITPPLGVRGSLIKPSARILSCPSRRCRRDWAFSFIATSKPRSGAFLFPEQRRKRRALTGLCKPARAAGFPNGRPGAPDPPWGRPPRARTCHDGPGARARHDQMTVPRQPSAGDRRPTDGGVALIGGGTTYRHKSR